MNKFLFIMLLCSCSVIEDYKHVGEETICGTMKYELQLHEHIKGEDSLYHCFYYHDTIVENYELTIDNFKKIKRLVWYRK